LYVRVLLPHITCNKKTNLPMAIKSNRLKARRQRKLNQSHARASARKRSHRVHRHVRRQVNRATSRIFFEVLQSKVVQKALEELMPDYRERVYPPTVVLAMFLEQVLSHHSCRAAITEAKFAGLIDKDASMNTKSYCEARERFPIELVKKLVEVIADEMQRRAPGQWKWRERHVKLVDGSSTQMPDTPENQKEFPQHGRQKKGAGYPCARLVGVISLATGALLGIGMAKFKGKGTGEHSILRELMHCFSEGDVAIGDAYYAAYFLIAELQRMGVDFVFEQHGARSTDFRAGKKLGYRDHIVTWIKPACPKWMTKEEYASVPDELTVREVQIRSKVLVTSFIDPRQVSKREVGRLFEQRWHIEVDLRNIKSTLGMDKLSCRSPDMCGKELWVYMLAYNLVRLLMAEAAVRADVLPRQLSFQHTVEAWLAWAHRQINLGPPESLDMLFDIIGAVRVGNRPGRAEPRVIKQRPKAFPRLNTTRREARRKLRLHGHPKKLVA
jgi:hypothetical protein